MAFFEFLKTAAPLIGQVGGAVTAGKGIFDLFTRERDVYEEIPSLVEMLNAANASRVYAQAAGDPTSPYFKNLSGQFDEENRRNVVAAIRQIQRENSRAIARGDPAFGIAPERRDESRAKAVAQLFQLSKERARDETRNQLLGASGASARAAGSFAPSLPFFAQYGDLNETMRGSGMEALSRLFGQLAGGDGGGPASILGGGSALSRTASVPQSSYAPAPSGTNPSSAWWMYPEAQRYPQVIR